MAKVWTFLANKSILDQDSTGRRRPGSLSPSWLSFVAFLGEQTSWIETRSFRTGTRYLKIQDGQDVDVLWRPVPDTVSEKSVRLALAQRNSRKSV